MNTVNCEYVREVFPDVLHGKADAELATVVRLHIAGCAECRAEAEVIAGLFGATVPVPAGLHERVIRAYQATSRARRIAPRHLAMAATVAAALIGGTLLIDSTRSPVVTPVTTSQESGLGVVTVDAAMATGTGSLEDLTVEELEQLLGEIES